MSERLTVAVDVDGVLLNFVERFRQRVNSWLTDACALPNNWQPQHWEMLDDPKIKALNLPRSVLRDIYSAPGLAEDLPVYEDGLALVRALAASGVQMVFCTSPMRSNTQWCYYRLKQLEALNMQYGWHAEVNIVTDKRFTAAHVLIDDKRDNAVDFCSKGKVGVLWDRPYNQGVSAPFRAKSVEEALTVVRLALQLRPDLSI